MAEPVTLTVDQGIATMRIARAHGNAINAELLEGLIARAAEAEADPRVRGVLLAASGKLFSPGLDLQELIELDRPVMQRFLERFNACILALYGFSKPMVAALHGHAVAGGCVLSLSADWRILKRGAMIGLNEVRVGVPLPFAVSMILRDSVPAAHREEVALFGRNYTDEEALSVGLVHEIRPEEGFEAYCRERLEVLASQHPRALTMTKRYLRSPTLKRIREGDPGSEEEFLDAWFSPETRARIQSIVDQLRA